jgi:hypothetical protein
MAVSGSCRWQSTHVFKEALPHLARETIAGARPPQYVIRRGGISIEACLRLDAPRPAYSCPTPIRVS